MAFNWGNAATGGVLGAKAGNSLFPGIGGLAGGALGALSGFFGGDEDEETNKLLDQIPDELKQYLMPYINAGQNALPALNDVSGEYQKLYQDPNAIIARIGGGYKQSPGYQWKLGQGENAITNAAAMNGMAGTAQHQQQAGELAEHLADQDYQDYLGKALGLFTGGLEGRRGIEQGIFDTGANASGSLATGLSNYMLGRAGLNYTRQANQNQANSDIFSSLLSYFKGK